MIFDKIDLNESQLEAIKYTKGPSVVISGAGSGKTRVLTYKIAYLISEQKISPYNILALTFTNKAAREMKDRLIKLIGDYAQNLWIGTFHSVFAKILRIEGQAIGYMSSFTIYDREDSKSIIKSIVKELNLDDKIYNPNTVLSRISGAKNRLLTAETYSKDIICQDDDMSAKRPMLGKIYLMYENRCFKANAMDFDDILINTYRLFNQHPEILYKYQEKFKFILIDEFQDTNLVQFNIIKDLARVHNNICVVGDDAQSIYAFRGANIYNMLNFQDNFKETRIFKLEQNYRSTQNIVNAANSIIKNNTNQTKKESWTINEKGSPIFVTEHIDNLHEARYIANSIHEKHISKHLPYSKFAVLCRTNYQFRSIEEEFRKNSIPYKIVGGISFYQRKEIKDILAYFKFALNYSDLESFKRIINTPKRGIGPSTIDKLTIAAFENDMSLWEALKNAKHFVKGKVLEKIENFVDMIQVAHIKAQTEDAYEVGSYLSQRSGLLKELKEDASINGSTKHDNVQEILNAIKNFTLNKNDDLVVDENNDYNVRTGSLEHFIQEVALLTSWDEVESKEARDSVTIMTIHSSKGLEFEQVYVTGLEEQLFPSAMMTSSNDDLEEERRLFYVAVTRAKKEVHLSYALRRFKFGNEVSCIPSRFLKEIDQNFIKFNKESFHKRSFSNFPNKNFDFLKNKKKPPLLYPDFQASDPSIFKKNMKVIHPRFGTGVITSIESTHGSDKATIVFDKFGQKTLMLNFAKLKALN